MKEKVIEFLGNLPKSGQEQFNKALELYRKSKNHSESQVRFMNAQGYSPERLKILIYELQKLHGISDVEVAKARKSTLTVVEKEEKPAPVSSGNTAASVNDADLQIVEAKDKIVDLPENASADEVTEKIENAPAVDTQVDVKDIDVVDSQVVTSENNEGLSEELKQKLSDFDVDARSYNEIKSFAADLSDATKLDAANQKSATLKAFIQVAKKKFIAS